MSHICEKCGFALEADAVFCPNCGTKVSTTASSDTLGRVPAICGQCGAKLKKDAKFCNKCGAPIGAIVKQNKISNPLQPVQSSSAPLTMQSSMQSMKLPAGINLPPGYAAIEVIREWRFYGLGGDFGIFLDDTEIGRVKNNSRQTFQIQPGAHILTARVMFSDFGSEFVRKLNGYSPPFPFEIKAGEFLRLGCNFTFGKLVGTTILPLILSFAENGKILKFEPRMF